MRNLSARAALLGAVAAAALFSTPAIAQPAADAAQQPPPAAADATAANNAGQDSATGSIVITARRTEEKLQRVPASVSAFNARALDRIQAQDTTGLQGAVPEPQHRPGPRLVERDQHLHPRHRPARRAADLRSRGRRLCRRRLSLAHPRQPARPARPRPDRGAARPAGHALRQEHDRRRDQVRHPPARATRSAPMARSPAGSYDQLEAKGTLSGPITQGFDIGVSVLRLPARRVRRGFGRRSRIQQQEDRWRRGRRRAQPNVTKSAST